MFYHIQNEKGESGNFPNVCRILPRNPGVVTLSDIHESFPLRGSGSYHFRFQVVHRDDSIAFIDLIHPDDIVPLVKGNAVTKVLRLDTLKCAPRPVAGLNMKPLAQSSRPAAPIQRAAAPASAKAAAAPAAKIAPVRAAAPQAPVAVPIKMPTMDTKTPHYVVPKEIDGDTHIRCTGEAVLHSRLQEADENGMRPIRQVEVEGDFEVPSEVDEDLADKSDYVKARAMARRLELRKKQEERAAEIAAREREAAEAVRIMDETKAKSEAKLKEWALEMGTSIRNIRVLISTLQNVLWEGARWEPVPMAQLIVPKRVRIHYMKAVTVVHPDKVSGMGPAEQYLAGQVFYYLEQAWRKFQAEELGQ